VLTQVSSAVKGAGGRSHQRCNTHTHTHTQLERSDEGSRPVEEGDEGSRMCDGMS
jgi:hypothetical protein